MASSRVPPHARKRGDNRVLFGGDACSARRSPDDVPGFVGVECSTKRAQERGSSHVRALLRTTKAAKSGRRAEATCWGHRDRAWMGVTTSNWCSCVPALRRYARKELGGNDDPAVVLD